MDNDFSEYFSTVAYSFSDRIIEVYECSDSNWATLDMLRDFDLYLPKICTSVDS